MTTQTTQCSKCGAPKLAESSRFCASCGTAFPGSNTANQMIAAPAKQPSSSSQNHTAAFSEKPFMPGALTALVGGVGAVIGWLMPWIKISAFFKSTDANAPTLLMISLSGGIPDGRSTLMSILLWIVWIGGPIIAGLMAFLTIRTGWNLMAAPTSRPPDKYTIAKNMRSLKSWAKAAIIILLLFYATVWFFSRITFIAPAPGIAFTACAFIVSYAGASFTLTRNA